MEKLYEVAVLEHPLKKEREEEGKTSRLVEFKRVMAKSDQNAAILAVRRCTEEIDDARLEVVVRPFA